MTLRPHTYLVDISETIGMETFNLYRFRFVNYKAYQSSTITKQVSTFSQFPSTIHTITPPLNGAWESSEHPAPPGCGEEPSGPPGLDARWRRRKRHYIGARQEHRKMG